MPLSRFFRWIRPNAPKTYRKKRLTPVLTALEGRDVPAGYAAVAAGPGALPAVAIRVDIQDQLGGSGPNNLGQPPDARSDGRTDFVSQIFFPFITGFRGGVKVATGNFDGLYGTPDQLVTAAGPGGGPHVIIWNMRQLSSGAIVTDGIRDQFYAFDARFRGGVNVAAGDLDGDGKAELICAAGAGGGPHVKIYRDVNGRFQLANEFFAFDASFRGGVSVASGQGYKTVVQQRYVLAADHPDDFIPTPYTDIPNQQPGLALGIPLNGFDSPVPPGGFTGIGTFTAPAGIEGHLLPDLSPRPYFTVASGFMQYNSANLLNQFGNIVYRPNIFIDPDNNPDNIGEIVYATWPADAVNPPSFPFVPDAVYGPFVRLSPITTPDGDIQRITRFTQSPNQVTFRNQLVVGAGPGGGPHVKVYDFAGTAGGQLINQGAGKEFFAFDASFRGGVNVAIGDVLMHTNPSGLSGRTDFQDPARSFIVDSNENSGTQAFFQYPFPTELYRRNTPEIVIGMASLGNQVRIFGDQNFSTIDPTNPLTDFSPARRTAIQQVVPLAFTIDTVQVVDPTNPLGGYTNFVTDESFRRGVADPLTYTGGVDVAISRFNFGGGARFGQFIGPMTGGTGETSYRGFGVPFSLDGNGQPIFSGGARIATNPALGQLTVTSTSQVGPTAFGSRIRLFNEVGPFVPTDTEYAAYDDFAGPVGTQGSRAGSTAFGSGVLPEPSLEVIYANYATGQGGAITDNVMDFRTVDEVSDPILVTV